MKFELRLKTKEEFERDMDKFSPVAIIIAAAILLALCFISIKFDIPIFVE